MSDELQTAATWLTDGRKVALATVIQTWGSAPRPAGSQIVVRDDGAFLGSVSGGCVERAVIEAALSTIADSKNRETKSKWLKRGCFHNFARGWRIHFSDFGQSATR